MRQEDGVSAAEMAETLALSRRFLFKLATLPDFPARPAPGRFDAKAVAKWYIRRMHDEMQRRGNADGPTLAAAKLALVAAQADRVELTNSVSRGELVPVDAVRLLWSRRISTCQQRLRTIPSSVGPALVRKSRPFCEASVSAAIEAALRELDGPAAAAANPRRDGRRRRAL